MMLDVRVGDVVVFEIFAATQRAWFKLQSQKLALPLTKAKTTAERLSSLCRCYMRWFDQLYLSAISKKTI